MSKSKAESKRRLREKRTRRSDAFTKFVEECGCLEDFQQIQKVLNKGKGTYARTDFAWELEEASTPDTHDRERIIELKQAANKVRFTLLPEARDVSAIDFLERGPWIADFLRSVSCLPANAMVHSIDQAVVARLTELFNQTNLQSAFESVCSSIGIIVAGWQDLKKSCYGPSVTLCRIPNELRFRFECRIGSCELKRIAIDIEGHTRPCFECVSFDCDNGHFSPIYWDNSVLADLQPGERYAVFIQSHTIVRLRERLLVKEGSSSEGYIHSAVRSSLSQPTFVDGKNSSDKFWVELFNGPHKLGYLVGGLAAGSIVIKTFLFLTNEGTPENSFLKRRGVDFNAMNYVNLDTMLGFSSPQVRSDPGLRKIFAECGIGHLLTDDVSTVLGSTSSGRSDVSYMKKIFRLD